MRKNFQSGQKIIQKSCSLKFTAFMHTAKQVWIWYSCLYWPTLFCIFSDIDLVLLLKSAKKKKDLANIKQIDLMLGQ